jgi:alkane 1-monooxygenase
VWNNTDESQTQTLFTMKWNNLKYLIAYIAPLAALWGLYEQGHWSFAGIYVGFVMIPLLEIVSPQSTHNFSPEEETKQLNTWFFDLLLYLNVPLLFFILHVYFQQVFAGTAQTYELVGMTCSVGLIAGTIGINVAHELGHRSKASEIIMAKMLLLSALYMHFFIEHNRGHHKHVSTDADPASARLGENLYAFWLRSVTGSWRNAWKLEAERLQKTNSAHWFSWNNEMLRFQVFQLGYLLSVGLFYAWWMVPYAIAVAVFGFLLLECVNYIEHYGLRRKMLPNGRPEPVQPWHSWNSDHELGRIFLYELTRHSDHHFKTSRKYQILRHFDESPQLPFGYPTSIIISLLPPLWFALMNPRVKQEQNRQLVVNPLDAI